MKPGSQAYRLRAILADEEWHTTADLLREVPCIVHSRISDLRAAGYVVEHETTGVGARGSRYRLVQETGGDDAVTSPPGEAAVEPPLAVRSIEGERQMCLDMAAAFVGNPANQHGKTLADYINETYDRIESAA